MEPYVLQGAGEMLRARKIEVALIEVCPGNIRAVGLVPEYLFNVVSESGYLPYELTPAGCAGRKLDLRDFEAMSLANVLLLSPEGNSSVL
jgi:hypothetical protein